MTLMTNKTISRHHSSSSSVSDGDRTRKMRRAAANSNERRRMESINNGFIELKKLLPNVCSEKMSKAAILQRSAQFIQCLMSENKRLQAKALGFASAGRNDDCACCEASCRGCEKGASVPRKHPAAQTLDDYCDDPLRPKRRCAQDAPLPASRDALVDANLSPPRSVAGDTPANSGTDEPATRHLHALPVEPLTEQHLQQLHAAGIQLPPVSLPSSWPPASHFFNRTPVANAYGQSFSPLSVALSAAASQGLSSQASTRLDALSPPAAKPPLVISPAAEIELMASAREDRFERPTLKPGERCRTVSDSCVIRGPDAAPKSTPLPLKYRIKQDPRILRLIEQDMS